MNGTFEQVLFVSAFVLAQNKRRKLCGFLPFQIILGNSWFPLSSVTQTEKEQTLHKISVDSAC